MAEIEGYREIKLTLGNKLCGAFRPHADPGFDEGMEPAKPLKTPSPDFGANLVRRNMGTPLINAYGIIDKDGSLQNIKVLSSNAEIRDVIAETLKNWRYHPAMCGSNPVATEKEVPISLFGTMGGGGGDDAPRGRGR